MRILLVEDDSLLGDGIQVGLQQSGFTVDWLTLAEDALHALQHETFDALVLDWKLPGLSGIDLVKRLRKQGNTTAIIMLTARDSVEDRIHGLDSGADDYLIKPFDLEELAARLRALLRRQGGRATPLLENGPLIMDPATHMVSLHGKPLALSNKEYRLLQLFMENIGKVLSKNRMEDAVYGWSNDIESNTLEVFIHHLRRKLEIPLIRTIRGVGYMMDKVE
ncbi:MAG: response regulator transcription factor [Magnetococcales bacterium]|nr:response regulator transcription factor [Magnetococcales bacterium]